MGERAVWRRFRVVAAIRKRERDWNDLMITPAFVRVAFRDAYARYLKRREDYKEECKD